MRRFLFLALLSAVASVEAQELKLSKSLESLRFGGDLRLRQEALYPSGADRHRSRFRLRFGFEADFPGGAGAHVRLASGGSSQVSPNQTFENLSDKKALAIDQAYLDWTGSPYEALKLTLAGGKLANPFWRVGELVWDEDLNPEGAAQSARWSLGNASVWLSALQMAVDESAAARDPWMLGEQAGFELPLSGAKWTVAAAHYGWIRERRGSFGQPTTQEGNRRSGGTLLNEFGVAELSTELAWKAPFQVSVHAAFVRNLESRLSPAADDGFQAGLRLGDARARGGWEAAYYYRRVETDATVADVSDSDFGDSGGTNRRGHAAWAAYGLTDWAQLRARVMLTEVLDTTFAPGRDDLDRANLDLLVRF